MKKSNFILFYFIHLTLIISAQTEEQKILSDNNIYKKIIRGEEYHREKIIKESYIEEIYDSLGRTIEFLVYHNDKKLKHRHLYTYPDNNTTLHKQFTNEGELIYSFYTHESPSHNIKTSIQTNADKDTLIHQEWIRDINKEDSIIYRITNGVKTIQREYEYDKQGNRVKQFYTPFGLASNLTEKKVGNCTITKNEKSQIIKKECIEGNATTMYCFQNRTGYLYGIQLPKEVGGKIIFIDNNLDLRESRTVYSKKGKILARLTYEYLTRK